MRVSRSGYHDWLSRPESHKCFQRRKRDEKIKRCFFKSKERYGMLRIRHQLAKEGDSYNEKTIANSMKRQGFVPKAARKFKATTNSQHTLPVANN